VRVACLSTRTELPTNRHRLSRLSVFAEQITEPRSRTGGARARNLVRIVRWPFALTSSAEAAVATRVQELVVESAMPMLVSGSDGANHPNAEAKLRSHPCYLLLDWPSVRGVAYEIT
jgi:hypothetical protein